MFDSHIKCGRVRSPAHGWARILARRIALICTIGELCANTGRRGRRPSPLRDTGIYL